MNSGSYKISFGEWVMPVDEMSVRRFVILVGDKGVTLAEEQKVSVSDVPSASSDELRKKLEKMDVEVVTRLISKFYNHICVSSLETKTDTK